MISNLPILEYLLDNCLLKVNIAPRGKVYIIKGNCLMTDWECEIQRGNKAFRTYFDTQFKTVK